jgi:glycine/D-amino acid oxidase-like deaminating enzyme
MSSAEVVVIGGGVMGASVAWHLRELGVTGVVLCERDTLASGSTRASAGGIRTQFADEVNVRIALRSLDEFEGMEGIDFRQDGYLFLLDRARDVESFQAALALQHALGVPARELSVEEALQLLPQLDGDGLLAAMFCDLDGYATPEAVVQWYVRGLDVRQGCAVTGIEVAGGRVLGVETSEGRIATGAVVCCAGAWSGEVAALAGVELPVRGERRWMFFTPQDGGLPRSVPLTIDFSSGFYFHREGPGLVFGGREQSAEQLAEPAARRLPVLAELPVQSSWWGYYEVSPDWNALVGEAAEPARFLYATGFSGHGFQQAPAVGEHIAELVTGGKPTLDLSVLSADRFARGEQRPEAFVI